MSGLSACYAGAVPVSVWGTSGVTVAPGGAEMVTTGAGASGVTVTVAVGGVTGTGNTFFGNSFSTRGAIAGTFRSIRCRKEGSTASHKAFADSNHSARVNANTVT